MSLNRCRVQCLLCLFAGLVCAVMPAQAQERRGARRLAPGVLTVVPTHYDEGETFTGPVPLSTLVGSAPKWAPNYLAKSTTLGEQARQVVLRRDIWCLEFAFKPLRMIEVDVPQPSGKMQRKTIWYMVYRVKNNGNHLTPVAKEDKFGHKTFSTEALNKEVRFFPTFVLETKDLERSKAYLDRVIPAAVGPIQRREDPNIPLLNTVEISKISIPVSDARNDRSVWGVVTWEDIDPRMDYFAVYIEGLSNAFQVTEVEPGKFSYVQKTLQLNFWWPGDGRNNSEDQILYGVRLVTDEAEQRSIFGRYKVDSPIDYAWIYR